MTLLATSNEGELNTQMTAVVVQGAGVVLQEIAVPVPTETDVLVRVFACGMNRADLSVASGEKHGSIGGDGTVVGMEWAGEIVALGAKVPKTFAVGDRVMCSGRAAFAEFAVCDYGRVLNIPDQMDFSTASTLPIALQTMHQAIVSAGKFKAGQSVLIQGASSGVGLMGLQIAKRLGASVVIGTSTNTERRNRLNAYGADLALDSADPSWVESVQQATQGGVDLVIDMISGKTVNQSLAATRVLGTIVNVGRLGGAQEVFDFDQHAMRRINYIGVTFRTRSVAEVRDIVDGVRHDLFHLVADGSLDLPIDKTFRLSEAAEALQYMKSNAHFGKIVLLV